MGCESADDARLKTIERVQLRQVSDRPSRPMDERDRGAGERRAILNDGERHHRVASRVRVTCAVLIRGGWADADAADGGGEEGAALDA